MMLKPKRTECIYNNSDKAFRYADKLCTHLLKSKSKTRRLILLTIQGVLVSITCFFDNLQDIYVVNDSNNCQQFQNTLTDYSSPHCFFEILSSKLKRLFEKCWPHEVCVIHQYADMSCLIWKTKFMHMFNEKSDIFLSQNFRKQSAA